MRNALRPSCSLALCLVLAAGCTPPATGDAGVDGLDDQTPPEGADALEPWLEAELYRAWSCSDAIGDATNGSPHGRRLVCVNDAMVLTPDGEALPVGAAAVKELYDDSDERSGIAVLLKVEEGEGGDAWYWYERFGVLPAVANGRAAVGCVGCHEGAASAGGRELVYTASP